MNPHLTTEELIHLLEGADPSLPDLMAHLKDCSQCQSELKILQKIEKTAGQVIVEEVPDWFTERIMTRTRSIWAPWVWRAWIKRHQQWFWGGAGLVVVFLSQFSKKSTNPSLLDFFKPETQKYGDVVSKNLNGLLAGIREVIPFLFENGNPLIFFSLGLTLVLLYFVDRYFKQSITKRTI
jgi:hypothetical protein